MKDLHEDVKKILETLTEEERACLPHYRNLKFPDYLSVILLMKGWTPEDTVKVANKARESLPEDVI